MDFASQSKVQFTVTSDILYLLSNNTWLANCPELQSNNLSSAAVKELVTLDPHSGA